jgi:hypothetical protein
MPGIFSYSAATHPAMVTGGAAGLAADRGHGAPLPAAQAAASNSFLAGEGGPVANREQSQTVGRIFS